MSIIKRIIFIVLFLGITSNAYALNLSRVKTWAASEILTAADLNGEFNNILNHSLTNNDISASAGIVGSKLDLSSPGVIGATTAAAGTFTTMTLTGALTANSTAIFKDKVSFTQTDNNEYIDSLADGYLDFEATTGLRLRINAVEQVNLIDGVLAPTTDNDIDLGSTTKEFKDLWITGTANIDALNADTANIDAGTMDGVQVGGTTATGELLVNDALDDADGLGSQGTSGQFLKSAGAGANPIWGSASAVLLSATAVSTTNSGDITIAANKIYFVIFEIVTSGTPAEIGLRFDSDTTATGYQWGAMPVAFHATPGITSVGADSDSEISLTNGGIAAGNPFSGHFYIDTTNKSTQGAFIWGTTNYRDNSTSKNVMASFGGRYLINASVTSFEFFSTMTLTGDIYVYEYQFAP